MNIENKKHLYKVVNRVNICYGLILIAVLSLMLFTKVLRVSGISMEPTYQDGDIIFSVPTTEFEKGDVIGIYVDEVQSYVIKRVLATPGDYVVSSPTEVIVNGEVIFQMPFTTESSKTGIVADNKLFIVGDNYIDSYDSRYFGAVPVEGKVYRVIQGIRIPKNVVTIIQFIQVTALVVLAVYLFKRSTNSQKEINNEKKRNEGS